MWRLARPLAADEHRARFWVGHVRIGLMVVETSGIFSMLYVLLADRPHPHLQLALGIAIVLICPVALAAPIERWSYDHRGALFFYCWTTASTVSIGAISIIDGGASSPLPWLLVLTLTYTALTYPPLGVLLMGSFMTVTYLVVVATSAAETRTTGWGLTLATLVIFTVMTAWASRNHWDLSDQQFLLHARLETLADTDELTRLLNRRSLDLHLSERAAAARADRPLSLCVIDLDGFKEVNDSQGHVAGDSVLVAVAAALLDVCRETDHVGRLGGDEFAVVLPGADQDDAAAVGSRLHAAIRAVGAPTGVTASIGVVTCTVPTTSTALIAQADSLMYQAKALGRDRVCQARCDVLAPVPAP